MKEQKQPTLPVLHEFFLTWFYTGKSPKAPGTVGSLAALPLLYFLSSLELSLTSHLLIISILTALAIWSAQTIQKKFHLKDPQWIVIDEVIGMMVTWSFCPKKDFLTLATVFITFRFFDILKFWPASRIDKINHGAGTICDDIVSGLYAGILTKLLLSFLNT